MRRNSDELIRSIWRRAGEGDLEAARELVRVLERIQGKRPAWEPATPPTLEEWAESTAEVVLRGGGREFTDAEFDRWRRRDVGRTMEVANAIDATVDSATENMAAIYARSTAERIAFDVAQGELDQNLVSRIEGYLVLSLTEALSDDYLGWGPKLLRRVREILRRGS
jgi:hypothetical protein